MWSGDRARPLTGRLRDAHQVLAGTTLMTVGYVLAIADRLVSIVAAVTLVGIGHAGPIDAGGGHNVGSSGFSGPGW